MTQEKRTRANGRATREAILKTALDLFAERGHRGTSMAEIASRVGMTQPGLLHHFSSKDQLLLEVVRARESATDPAITQHVRNGRFDLPGAVRALAEINAAAPVEQLLLTTLSAESVPADHPLHDHFVERYRSSRTALAGALRRAQDAGQVRAELDADALAREMIATLDGLHLQWLLDPDEVDLVQALGDYADRTAREVAPRATADSSS